MPRKNRRNDNFKKSNTPSTKFNPQKILKDLKKEYSFNNAEPANNEDRN